MAAAQHGTLFIHTDNSLVVSTSFAGRSNGLITPILQRSEGLRSDMFVAMRSGNISDYQWTS
jgi:hypothetical protein